MAEEIEINSGFQHVLDRIAAGVPSLFVTGEAGTGKSTLLRHYREKYAENAVFLAPTGVAALNIQGSTIHRFFGFRPGVTPEFVAGMKPRQDENLYKSLKTIVVDEASMVRADLMDCMDVFLRKNGPAPGTPFGGVQMIFVGDLYQLPPVVGREEREEFKQRYLSPYFFASKVIQEAGVEIAQLDTIYRQKDPEFVRLLNHVRNDTLKAADLEILNRRHHPDAVKILEESRDGSLVMCLTTTNRNAEQINSSRLRALEGEEHRTRAWISNDYPKDSYPTEPYLSFKVGAQIMMVNNDPDGRWVNGSVAVIEEILGDGRSVGVKLQDPPEGKRDRVRVDRFTWKETRYGMDGGNLVSREVGEFKQLPFKLAWAVTIHKSQGKTFDQVVIDLGPKGAFANGQTYVALSRCTSLEGIHLAVPIGKKSIRSDLRIRNFLEANGVVAQGPAVRETESAPAPVAAAPAVVAPSSSPSPEGRLFQPDPGLRLDGLLGTERALEVLELHARMVQEMAGEAPGEIRFGNLANLGWEDSSSKRLLEFRMPPASLPKEILAEINEQFQGAGIPPLSGDPADLESGRETRTLRLPVELTLEGVPAMVEDREGWMAPNGSRKPLKIPGTGDGAGEFQDWLKEHPRLEPDPAQLPAGMDAALSRFTCRQMVRPQVLDGSRHRQLVKAVESLEGRPGLEGVQATMVRNAGSQYLDGLAGLGSMDPDGSRVRQGGEIRLSAAYVGTVARRALVELHTNGGSPGKAAADAPPVDLGPVDGVQAVLAVRTGLRSQQVKDRGASRDGPGIG